MRDPFSVKQIDMPEGYQWAPGPMQNVSGVPPPPRHPPTGCRETSPGRRLHLAAAALRKRLTFRLGARLKISNTSTELSSIFRQHQGGLILQAVARGCLQHSGEFHHANVKIPFLTQRQNMAGRFGTSAGTSHLLFL